MDSSDAPPIKHRHVPPEIVEQILLNLRVEPLLRFSSVSKSWNSIILGSQFARKHRSRAAALGRETIVLKHVRYIETPSSFPLSAAVSPEKPAADPDSDSPAFVFPFKHTTSIVAYCDGMCCLVNSKKKSVLLWNPSTRERSALPQTHAQTHDQRVYVYGLGYDPINDDYKIAKLGFRNFEPAQLYSLRSNSWKEITPPSFRCRSSSQKMGVPLGRALHWLSFKSGFPRAVVSLDLSTEEYREIALPAELDKPSSFIGERMNLIVLKGKLCFYMNFFERFAVWVMEDYGVAESWTKKLEIVTSGSNISLASPISTLLYLFEDGRLLIGVHWEWMLVLAQLGTGGEYEAGMEHVLLPEDEEEETELNMNVPVVLEQIDSISESFVYVESLVSPAMWAGRRDLT